MRTKAAQPHKHGGSLPSSRLSQAGISFKQAVTSHLFCPPGQGQLEFEPVFAALDRVGYQGWFVIKAEQDPQRHDPVAVTAESVEYLAGRFRL